MHAACMIACVNSVVVIVVFFYKKLIMTNNMNEERSEPISILQEILHTFLM